VHLPITSTAPSLVDDLDDAHARMCSHERDFFRMLAQGDLEQVWRGSGAQDMASWISMRYGITLWKARRWLHAAHALEVLPALSDAHSRGVLSTDKVVELARFASFEDEDRLIAWAQRVSSTAVRRRADLTIRRAIDEIRDAERQRFLTWWYSDDGARFGFEGELPAADGAVVAKAIDRLSEQVAVTPGEEDPVYASARRADALVMVASTRIGEDADPDRATVVVHLRAVADIDTSEIRADIEGGPVIDPETAKRLACEGRTQVVVEDEDGEPLGLGRITRNPTAWMMRQLRYRDLGCTFPGCGAQRFAKAHHVVWWRDGGRTDLDNLVLVCSFHHKLVHEHGWTIEREGGVVRWFEPDGALHVPGPAPRERPLPNVRFGRTPRPAGPLR